MSNKSRFTFGCLLKAILAPGILWRYGASAWFALRRATAHPSLTVFILIGLAVCVALLSAVPSYSAGVAERLLRVELRAREGPPPLSVRLRHREDPGRPTTMEQYRRIDAFMRGVVPGLLGVPVRAFVRAGGMDTHRIHPWNLPMTDVYIPEQARYAQMMFLEGLAEHVVIVDGTLWPAENSAEVPVIISEAGLDELGLEVGERYWYIGPDSKKNEKVPFRVVGMWRALDPSDREFWQDLSPDNSFTFKLIVREADFFGRVVPAFERPKLGEYSWFYALDPAALRVSSIGNVRLALRNLELDAVRLMPDTKMDLSPADSLDYLTRRNGELTSLLAIASLPLLATAVYYALVASGLVIGHFEDEIALFRSRGATTAQVVVSFFAERGLVGVAALALGLGLGAVLAQAIGLSAGFLTFTPRRLLPIEVGQDALMFGAAGIVVAIVASVAPAIQAAGRSIVTQRARSARMEVAGRLTGLAFELGLLGISLYGYRLMATGATPLKAAATAQVPVEPSLLVVPAVMALSLSLLYRRAIGPVTRLVAFLLGNRAPVPIVLALRQVGRAPGGEAGVALLIALTFSLGTYSASLARTMESNISDRVRYGTPADVELALMWDVDPETGGLLEPPLGSLDVNGIADYTRIQAFSAKFGFDRRQATTVQVLGVDAATFSRVAWWRDDLAPVSGEQLLSSLHLDESGAIVSASVLQQYQVRVGDVIQVTFNNPASLSQDPLEMRIVASTGYFPTLYPAGGPFLVANLDYLQDMMGLSPYYIWARLQPGASARSVSSAISDNGVVVLRTKEQREVQRQALADPTVTGLLGVLTVGFLLSSLLSVLGFLLHSRLSLGSRLPQFGVLRTIGLSKAQLVLALLTETMLVVAVSLAGGILIGMGLSRLFVPYLQDTLDKVDKAPPFIVITPTNELGLLSVCSAVMIVLGAATTIGLVSRMRLHEAAKMGERG